MILEFSKCFDQFFGDDAIQATHFFPNGYGVSVVRHKFSRGNKKELYELAVLLGDEQESELTYKTPITGDVIGHLSLEDANATAQQIKDLPDAKTKASC